METKNEMKNMKYIGITMALCVFIAILNFKRFENLGAFSYYKDFKQ
jgi:hypothetical protein